MLFNNTIYAPFITIDCIAKWTSTFGVGADRIPQPHRLRKTVARIYFQKTPEIEEFSSYIINDEVIKRDVMYATFSENDNKYHISNLCKNIYYCKFIVYNNEFVYDVYAEPFVLNTLIDKCKFLEMSTLKLVTDETIYNKKIEDAVPQIPQVKPVNKNKQYLQYSGVKEVQKTTTYTPSKKIGLLPPCIVVTKTEGYHVLRPVNRSGQIITSFIENDKINYLAVRVENKEIYVGSVVYVKILSNKYTPPESLSYNDSYIVAKVVPHTECIVYKDMINCKIVRDLKLKLNTTDGDE